MKIDELIALLTEERARYEESNQATIVKNWGNGIKIAIGLIEANRAGFDKAQALADLVPGLVEAIEWGTNATPTGKTRNEMTDRIMDARDLMEENGDEDLDS